MNDAGFALSVAYAALLADLAYQDKPVKVYDQQADDAAVAPYVILGPWISNPANTKDTFNNEGEITLDVVTRFKGNQGSRKPANDIANLITSLVKPTPASEVLNVPGFESWKTVVVGGRDLQQTTSSEKIYRRLITISHSLKQI